jgi:PE family protein
MSAVIADPEMMTAAASDMAAIGDTLNAAHMTAAVPTVAVLPAAADEVSAGIAHLFSGYGQEYQKLAGEAAASYEQFAQHLTASAGAYAGAEDAIAAFLQDFPIWATTTLPELALQLLILILVYGGSALLIATVLPLLAVVLPLVIAVALPFSIAGLAALFGPPILLVLLAELGAAL